MPDLNSSETLGSLCHFINGGAWNESEYVEQGVPVLKVSNFRNNEYSLDDISYLSEKGSKKYSRNRVELNDFVIATVGSHPNLVNSAAGKTIAITKKVVGYLLNQNAVVLRTKNPRTLDQKYLTYLGETDGFRHYIQVRGKGAASQMRIAIGDIKSFPVRMISLHQQHSITAILSAYDDLIENNLERIKLLEEMALITYEEWFVRMKFPGYKEAEIDSETGLPEDWSVIKIGSILGKVPKTKKLKTDAYLSNGKYPIVDQSRNFIAGYTDDKDGLLDLSYPAIVFGDHTRVVKFINFKFVRGADGTQILLSNEKRMPQHLFYLSVMNVDLSDYHYARHFKYLKDSEILVPNQTIASSFEAKIKSVFDLILILRNQVDLLKDARNILLPRLMTGMIDIDRVELPEALLARIDNENDNN